MYLSASWYHSKETMPYYLSIIINGENENDYFEILVDLETLELITQPWQTKLNEECLIEYKNGIKTLTEIMPLYDTGHRTNYDLTHFTAQSYPNHASWHYHTLHIDMMKAINHIEQVNPFMNTIERWEGYLKGNNVSRD